MLKKNFAANFANQLIGVGFPVIIQIYIIRHLDLVDIGFWNTLLAAQSIVILSVSFVSLHAIKKISSTNDVCEQSVYVTNFSALMYALMIVPISLALTFLINAYHNAWQIVIICFLPLITTPLAAEFYFQATLKNDIIFYRRLFSRIIFLILLLTLVKESADFTVYVCIVSLTIMLEHLVNFFFVKKLFDLKALSISKQKEMVTSSFGYLPFNLSYNTLPQLSVLIGARVLSAETLAVFSILVKLVNLATTFVSSSVMVIYPYRLNRKYAHAQSRDTADRDDFFLYLSLTVISAVAVVLGLILFKPLIYFLFLDNQTSQFGYMEYYILACYVFVHSVYNYVVFNYFFEHNQLKRVIIANVSMIIIFVSIVMGAFLLGFSVVISGIFLLAALIPASTLILISYRERRAESLKRIS